MNRIRLIATDVEGCLTHPGRGPANHPGLARIQSYCNLAGIYRDKPPIILVTGRGREYAEATVQAIGALGPYFNVPSVIENGTLVYLHNAKTTRKTRAVHERMEGIEAVRRFVDGPFREKHNGRFTQESGKEVCISLNPVGQSIEALYQAVLVDFEETMLKDKDGNPMGRKPIDFVDATHSRSAVDITPKGVNKLTGLQEALEAHGIKPEEILGIGDSKGDVPWLQHIGFRAGPRNADENIRAVPGIWISRYDQADGVANIIDHFVGLGLA